jgi:AraC family transcriptional regulator of arabinose operon
MKINNIGYNHCHDVDLNINRPNGSGDYLLLVVKTPYIFTIDGVDTLVNENSIVLYDKDFPQYYKSSGTAFSNDWIHFLFEDDELEDFLSLKIPFNTPISLNSITEFSVIVKALTYEHYSMETYNHSIINHYFEILFLKLSRAINHPNVIKATSNYEMLSTIRSKIYAKPYERRTIDSTAHEVRMSKAYFQHLYKKFFGVSLIQDITQSRLDFATNLLLDTNISIKDISQLCGYNNYAHFERLFKNKIGLTPTQYRTSKTLKD